MCPFICQSWAFSESETFSRNVESWRLNASILSLKRDTKLSVTSWSHLLLISSICCASGAVNQAGLTNRLRSVNLLSKLFDTVSFSWLLAMAQWWIHWMRRNKVCTVCAKFWSAEGFSVLSIWSTFFSCPWFESCQDFDEWIKAEIFTKD